MASFIHNLYSSMTIIVIALHLICYSHSISQDSTFSWILSIIVVSQRTYCWPTSETSPARKSSTLSSNRSNLLENTMDNEFTMEWIPNSIRINNISSNQDDEPNQVMMLVSVCLFLYCN